MYLPVRVSILIFSPVLMNSGAWTVMPVSSVMAFWTLLAESPRMPSGASVTVSTTLDGNLDGHGLVLDERHRHQAVFHEIIFRVADEFRRERDGFVVFRVGEDVILAVLVAEFHLAW